MLVWIDENRKLMAINDTVTRAEAEAYISPTCLWVDEALIYPECKDNEVINAYLTEDMTFRYQITKLLQPEPTPDELYRAVNLLNQAEIIANQRQQDKVMAAILLEQVGGEANV